MPKRENIILNIDEYSAGQTQGHEYEVLSSERKKKDLFTEVSSQVHGHKKWSTLWKVLETKNYDRSSEFIRMAYLQF